MGHTIYLVGARAAGKTTFGGALARQLGCNYVDTDIHLRETTGETVADIVAREGWDGFRKRESAVLRAVTAPGTVIATGGGIVTRRENWAPMRENSTVIFLRRPLDQLPLDGRPVSQANPLEELYEKRLPLYEKAADLTVDNDQVDRAVDEIIRRLKL